MDQVVDKWKAALSTTIPRTFDGKKTVNVGPLTTNLAVSFRLEVCMGVGNPMGIPFPWESHGNGNSHTAHDGNGNGNGNEANGNGNSIYFTRVKIPKIIVMH